MARLALTLAALANMALVACAPPNKATPYPPGPAVKAPANAAKKSAATAPTARKGVARFFGREVDLQPFLAGFPYTQFEASLRTGKLFFLRKGDTYTLEALDLVDEVPGGGYDLTKGRALSEVDWSKRSLWSVHHHEASNTLWLHADERNDEQMNLWTLDLEDQSLTQVTKHDYVYGYGFSDDGSQVAYLPRSGKSAPYRTCLRVREVESGLDREVVCDDAKLTFTWSAIRWSPDKRELYFNAQISGDRTRVQLVRLDLDAKKPKPKAVTPRRAKRNSPSALEGWVDGDVLLFTANDDGYSNLYGYSRRTGKVRQLTRFTEDLRSAKLTDHGVVGVHGTPAGSTLVLVDPRSGNVVYQRKMPGSAQVLDARHTTALIRHQSPDIVFEGIQAKVTPTGLEPTPAVMLPASLQDDIVQCEAKVVAIDTFDTDRATGRRRQLHAFVLEPKTPAADAGANLAMITAFYGGANRYSTFDHIMCAAGITVVSPAVRGSSGFGREFYSLNDKDLGGDEIVDLFYVGRWVEQQTGLSPARIGVYGGSHGGYATMRALTFPPETNGRNESYPLGFGLAHAGFSDIKTFYDATNIPDWVVLESGDPRKADDLTKMKDRSPMSHVARLQVPLLLTHGSADWRVPVAESRQFAEKARELERPVNYIEFEGQGHHIEGLELQRQLYQARFDFLMAVAKAAPKAGDAATSR